MPRRSRRVRRAAVALGVGASLLGALGGCATVQPQRALSTSGEAHMVAGGTTLDQPVSAVAAATRLVDEDGNPFSLSSLRGRIVVLAPLLTMCQETCPMTSSNMHAAALAAEQATGQSGHVVFLEITVDPARDTVRRLHAYARLYGGLPDWRLATGKPSDVLALWKALGISTDPTKPDDTVRDWMTGKLVHDSYDVHHQDVVMVIDPSGHLRWVTDGHPDARGTALPTTMQQFLSNEGRANYRRPGAAGASSWTARDVEKAVAYVQGLGGWSQGDSNP